MPLDWDLHFLTSAFASMPFATTATVFTLKKSAPF
jgi:hypothetical protein